MQNKVSEGFQYAVDVVKGNIDVCENVQLACQRFLDYTERADWEWEFCPEYVEHFLMFANMQKHVKGKDAGKNVILMPWQVFVISAIYGFRRKDNPNKRLVTDVIIFIPRKAGKSTLTAIIGLYELMFGETGPEVLTLAVDKEQASIVFNTAKGFVENAPLKLANGFKVRMYDIQKRNDSQSIFKALSRDAKKSGDGKNPSCAIVDEAAAITERNSIEVIHSGMVARENPLRIYITTASFTRDTKFYEDYAMVEAMLRGQSKDNPRWFGVLYGLDAGDDWAEPRNWCKVNPMHNISIFEEAIAARVQEAQAKPSALNELLCKTFNVWVSANTAWIDRRHWDNPEVIVKTEKRKEKPEASFIGFDLGQTSDLNAVVRLDRYGPEDYFAHFKCFLPEDSLDKVPTHYRPIYLQAIQKGTLKLTSGNVRDDNEIMDYIRQQCKKYDIKDIGYDNYNAANIVATLSSEGFPMERVAQGMSAMNNPSKEVEKLILSKKIKHLDDPFIGWTLGNCEVYVDVNDNIKVRKNVADYHAKVDPIVGLIIAMQRSLDNAFVSSSIGFDFIEV